MTKHNNKKKPIFKLKATLPYCHRPYYGEPTQNPLFDRRNFLGRYRRYLNYLKWLEKTNSNNPDGSNPTTIRHANENDFVNVLSNFWVTLDWDAIGYLLQQDIDDKFKALFEDWTEESYTFYERLIYAIDKLARGFSIKLAIMNVIKRSVVNVPIDSLIPYIIVVLALLVHRQTFTYNVKGFMLGESLNDASITYLADRFGIDDDAEIRKMIKKMANVYDQVMSLLNIETYPRSPDVVEFIKPVAYGLVVVMCACVAWFEIDMDSITSEDSEDKSSNEENTENSSENGKSGSEQNLERQNKNKHWRLYHKKKHKIKCDKVIL